MEKYSIFIDTFQDLGDVPFINKICDAPVNSSKYIFVILTNEAVNTTKFPIPKKYIEEYINNNNTTKFRNYEIVFHSAFSDIDIREILLKNNNFDSNIEYEIFNYCGTLKKSDIELFSSYAKKVKVSFSFDYRHLYEKPKITQDTLKGFKLAAESRYPSGQLTVDLLVINQHNQILLGLKNKLGQYVLPGGFYDPTDSSIEETAIRELKEETNIDTNKVQYLFSHRIDDRRYLGSKDTVITTVFLVKLDKSFEHQDIKASDDLDDISFFELDELPDDLFQQHRNLIEIYLDKYNK